MFRRDDLEMRVLILAPVGRDAVLLGKTLEQLGIDSAIAPDASALLSLMAEGFGAVLVTDEAMTSAHLHEMTRWLIAQPSWSDPPFIILTPNGRPSDHTNHRVEEFSSLGNFTLIERPVRPETIVSAVRSALRGRMKQYEVRSRQESLARAIADLEHFAHSASHDLKEPLRNISIFSELLLTQYAHASMSAEQDSCSSSGTAANVWISCSPISSRTRKPLAFLTSCRNLFRGEAA